MSCDFENKTLGCYVNIPSTYRVARTLGIRDWKKPLPCAEIQFSKIAIMKEYTMLGSSDCVDTWIGKCTNYSMYGMLIMIMQSTWQFNNNIIYKKKKKKEAKRKTHGAKKGAVVLYLHWRRCFCYAIFNICRITVELQSYNLISGKIENTNSKLSSENWNCYVRLSFFALEKGKKRLSFTYWMIANFIMVLFGIPFDIGVDSILLTHGYWYASQIHMVSKSNTEIS